MYTFGPSYGLEPLEPSIEPGLFKVFMGNHTEDCPGGAEAWRGWFKTRL